MKDEKNKTFSDISQLLTTRQYPFRSVRSLKSQGK